MPFQESIWNHLPFDGWPTWVNSKCNAYFFYDYPNKKQAPSLGGGVQGALRIFLRRAKTRQAVIVALHIDFSDTKNTDGLIPYLLG